MTRFCIGSTRQTELSNNPTIQLYLDGYFSPALALTLTLVLVPAPAPTPAAAAAAAPHSSINSLWINKNLLTLKQSF